MYSGIYGIRNAANSERFHYFTWLQRPQVCRFGWQSKISKDYLQKWVVQSDVLLAEFIKGVNIENKGLVRPTS